MHRTRVLVPISFSPQSDIALKLAKSLARRSNVMLTCLYVIEKPGFISGLVMTSELEKKIRREAEIRLSSKVNEIIPESEDVPYEVIITSGKVYRKILEKAIEFKAKLIFMGISDASDQATRQIGSNVARIIARSPVPVITTGKEDPTRMKEILLPLDLTDNVSIKIAQTLTIAELLNASVMVCTVLDHTMKALREAASKRLDLIVKIFSDYEIKSKATILETGRDISGEIIKYARDIRSDLIIMMTQEESNMTEMFIGSTAREVIRKSDIPVMSIIPSIQTNLYPYRALFGEVNNPIARKDMAGHLIHHA
jgi:nucleotide-binding universal stress UspA family protein